MCNLATLRFWCGHGEQQFLTSCDIPGCVPFHDEHDIPYPCRACNAPVVESLSNLDIPDADLGNQQNYMPSTSQQDDIIDFLDAPAEYSHIDPQLIEQNENEDDAVDDDGQALFPNWEFAENINALVSYNIQQSIEADEPAQEGEEEEETGENTAAVVSEYPSPQLHTWNPRPGGNNDVEDREQARLEHMRRMVGFVTPAPCSEIDEYEDYDTPSPMAKRFAPKELTPTPGARDCETYMEAAGETLDHPIAWLGTSMKDFLNLSDDAENERNEPSRPRISRLNLSRDCADLPDAKTFGIEKPCRDDLPILKKEVQRGQLEAVLSHQEIKREPKLRMPLAERDESSSPVFSSDSTISMYSTTPSTSSVRSNDRDGEFEFTMAEDDGKTIILTD